MPQIMFRPEETVTLPARKIHRTPRLLVADAYTIGGDKFQSDKAKEKSVYYIAFRRFLHKINPDLYREGDDRIILAGLQRILEKLFYEPVTHGEIDEAMKFLSLAKVTTNGLAPYDCPEHLWRRVVDEFNGRPPIRITAFPEGSIVYPNEPVIQIENLVEGFGELAAWFESRLLNCFAATERVTQNRHWLERLAETVREIDPTLSEPETYFNASLMLTDFGDRAAFTQEESEELGMYHLYVFSGTDTFCGGYQAWKNSNETPGLALSVNALAHRNVQAYELESDCYETLYNRAANGEILSMVADCYDFYYAVENYLLPLALRSQSENNGKVIVARPDSGNAVEQVTWVCRLAKRFGLYTEREINGKIWYFSTYLKFIEGNEMDFKVMMEIIHALMLEGFAPYSWGLFGMGGGLRNNIKRDNLSAKYALCAIGNELEGRVKFSEDLGKTTLPGPFLVSRAFRDVENRTTIKFRTEDGVDGMVEYFNGMNTEEPFGIGQSDGFMEIKNRIEEEWKFMPLTLTTKENNGYPISQAVRTKRLELLEKYAPKKIIRKNNL